MVLYLEYVILDNMIIDLLLLNLLGITFKDDFKKKNKLLSCFIGTISALCLPLIINYQVLLIIYKALTALIMILVLKRYKTYKKYFLYLIVFVVYTFLFGGLAIGFLNMFDINYTINGLLLYSCEFPVSVFVVIFWLGCWLFRRVILALNQQMKINNYLYKIELSDNGNTIEGVGFYDSGNTIDRNGECVNIISMEMFLKLHKEYPVEKLLFRNIDESCLKNPSYIDVKSMSSSSKYLSFTIDKMKINKNEYSNVVVAVATQNFKNFDCIINSSLLGGNNE